MAETGTVIQLMGNTALVEIQPNPGCRSCGMCVRHGDRMILEADAPPGIQPGQRVLIEGGQKAWVPTLLLFVVPAVDLTVGVIIGQYVDLGISHDVTSALLGGAFFAVSFATGLWFERRQHRTGCTPRPRIHPLE